MTSITTLRSQATFFILFTSSLMNHPSLLAQEANAPLLASKNMNLINFVIIGILFILLVVLFFSFQTRFKVTRELCIDLKSTLKKTETILAKTQKKLKQDSQQHADKLLRAEIGLFNLNAAGKIIYSNLAFQRLTELDEKTLLTKRFDHTIHPDDLPLFKQAWQELRDQPETAKDLFIRLITSEGTTTYVQCLLHLDTSRNLKSPVYTGWASEITPLKEEIKCKTAEIEQYVHYQKTTSELYYQLTASKPIALDSTPEELAKSILEHMQLTNCNDAFSRLYNTSPEELLGTPLHQLEAGCNPLKNSSTIELFIHSNYELLQFESTRDNKNGQHINLTNNIVGFIDGNELVAIWGSQLDITEQKRALKSESMKADFLQRILHTLPADICVKDTSCRYLYTTQNLASSRGTPKHDWVGKTVFEVMPATPHDYEKDSIAVMKSNKIACTEHSYTTPNASGWEETMLIPLTSQDNLVEGVISLSFDITQRKQEEEALKQKLTQSQAKAKELQSNLTHTEKELSQVIRELHSEKKQTAELQTNLERTKQSETQLLQNKKALLEQQETLNQTLLAQKEELKLEIEHGEKWKELIALKDRENEKLETLSISQKESLTQANESLKQTESALKTVTDELSDLKAKFDDQIEAETQILKREIANKQIIEQALRKDERELQAKIKKLTDSLTAIEKAVPLLSSSVTTHATLMQKVQY